MEQWDIICDLRTRWEYDNRLNVMVMILVIFLKLQCFRNAFQIYWPCRNQIKSTKQTM